MVYLCELYCPAALAPSLYSLYLTTQRVNGELLRCRWEFVSTLKYEWDVLRGNRPYRWTIWVCSLLLGFFTTHFKTDD